MTRPAKRILLTLLTTCAALHLCLTYANAAAVPDDLQALFDVGQYKPLLPKLNATLAKTPTSDSADRYSLLLLKGETLLHLKASSSAQDAFTAAALVAPDKDSISTAKATANLLKHSAAGKYQPKTRPADSPALPSAIDILDPASRKQAFAAFLTDLLATLTPQVTNATEITSLPPLLTLARKVSDARDVEIAGTSADAQTKDLLDKLAAQTSTLLTDAIKPLDAQVKAAQADARKRQREMGRRAPKGESSSLSPTDTDQLDSAVDQARQIITLIDQMQPIFGDAGDLKTPQSDAQKIITDANKLLTEYHHPTE
jgi:hypothetical protein